MKQAKHAKTTPPPVPKVAAAPSTSPTPDNPKAEPLSHKASMDTIPGDAPSKGSKAPT